MGPPQLFFFLMIGNVGRAVKKLHSRRDHGASALPASEPGPATGDPPRDASPASVINRSITL